MSWHGSTVVVISDAAWSQNVTSLRRTIQDAVRGAKDIEELRANLASTVLGHDFTNRVQRSGAKRT